MEHKMYSKKLSSLAPLFLGFLSLSAVMPVKSAMAHGFDGELGAGKQAVDLWAVTCSQGTARIFAEALDWGPGQQPKLSVQIIKGTAVTNITSPVANDPSNPNPTYSPQVLLVGGPGIYWMIVDKTGLGVKKYHVTVHCQTSGGFHTGTAISQLQDQ
jgi:hypothetical protein